MDVGKGRSLSSGVGLPVRRTAGAFRYLGPGFLTLQIVIWVPGCTLDESGFNALAISSDTTPPSAPEPLTATAVSSVGINLAWTGATDDMAVTGYLIERCQDASCSNFAQIATATGLAFNDTGLARSTSYTYRVRATDAAANLGPYSNTASATTSASIDTEPPTAPTSLTATAVAATRINLAWVAATDNVGVAGYIVERCLGASCTTFAEVGAAVTATFADTGLAGGTAYSYRVRANDASGNLGPYSNVASAMTSASNARPSFVQGSYGVPQTPQIGVTVPFTTTQAAGDLNVVLVGWNDGTALVNSVTDTAGNEYQLAIGPTVLPGMMSHAIYYAANIAASVANSVTVTFNRAAVFPDVRILQYHNVDPVNPVDVVAGGTGTSATSATPTLMTTNTVDLLVTGNVVSTAVASAGSGFTTRIITSPDGDLAADRVVTTVGSFGASAALVSAGSWVMQMVAFRALGSAP